MRKIIYHMRYLMSAKKIGKTCSSFTLIKAANQHSKPYSTQRHHHFLLETFDSYHLVDTTQPSISSVQNQMLLADYCSVAVDSHDLANRNRNCSPESDQIPRGVDLPLHKLPMLVDLYVAAQSIVAINDHLDNIQIPDFERIVIPAD